MVTNMSKVSATLPSVEFSTGTTPKSQWPRFTSSKTVAMLPTPTKSTAWPNRSIAAKWLKENSGPKYATFKTFCSAREPDMISRKMARTVVESSGPPDSWCISRTCLRTCSSRAGEKTSSPDAVFRRPISPAWAARSFTSLMICWSSLSILSRTTFSWANDLAPTLGGTEAAAAGSFFLAMMVPAQASRMMTA